jgi:tetratricopeptide (TPR) repeat protein
MLSRRCTLLGGALLGSALLGLLAACDGPPPEAPEAVAVPVLAPLPDLSAADPATEKQIRERYDFLLQRLRDPRTPASGLAWAYGQLGAVYHAYQLFPQARICYAEAVAQDPDEVRWLYALAHLERTEGRFAASNAAFDRVLVLRPDDVPTLVWLAENAFDEQRPEPSRAFFLQALARRPECVKAHFGLGRIALDQGAAAIAVAHLEDALALQDEATPIHYTLGLAWSRLGETLKARGFFRRVPASDLARIPVAFDDPLMQEISDLRSSAQSYARRGMRAIARRRFDVAIREFAHAVELNPERPDTRYNLAASLLQVGRRDEARRHLEELVGKRPDYAQGHVLLARMLTVTGELATAEDLLQQALELDPQLTAAHQALAEVRRRFAVP